MGIKKILAIIVLGLFLTSCNQNQNRHDEYICNPISKRASEVSVEIFKDRVTTQISNQPLYTFAILEEKPDRIIFGYKNFPGTQTKQTFYKKTKKFKWDAPNGKMVIVYSCLKLN